MTMATDIGQGAPILLFNDECGVCRRIARWVKKSAGTTAGVSSIVERPIGDDPDALLALNRDLGIWDAYEIIHLLMPDGTMKVGGEACAEVLRRLPSTRWFARAFSVKIFGFRPFQRILDVGYIALSDIRPVFGCESCGTPSAWLRPIEWTTKRIGSLFGRAHGTSRSTHFTGIKTHRAG
jgi:predicted DCC family thiol-disulfide oxidoreductase YuxK